MTTVDKYGQCVIDSQNYLQLFDLYANKKHEYEDRAWATARNSRSAEKTNVGLRRERGGSRINRAPCDDHGRAVDQRGDPGSGARGIRRNLAELKVAEGRSRH